MVSQTKGSLKPKLQSSNRQSSLDKHEDKYKSDAKDQKHPKMLF